MRIMLMAMGGSSHTEKWVCALRDRGHDIMLVTFYPPVAIDGVDIRYLKIRNRLSILWHVPGLKRLVREFRPDILHAHYASSCGLAAALTGFRPFVLSVWGDDVMVFPDRSPLHRWMIRQVIHAADRITATSDILKTQTLSLAQPCSPVTVIPFGVDLDRFQYFQREASDDVHIGTIRWLTPKYGLDGLIRAFARLQNDRGGLRLTIVGRGPLRESLERLASSLGVSESVEFVGGVPSADVIDYYRQFDIFAIPSVSPGETFGVTAVEAMATGLPTVASDIGGLPEVVADGETGTLVKPGDVDGLAAALQAYVDSPELRTRHGRAGRARAERLYNWQDDVEAMELLYREVLTDD